MLSYCLTSHTEDLPPPLHPAPSGDGSVDWRLVAEVCGDAGSTSVLALLRRGVDLRDRIIWTTYNRKVHAFRWGRRRGGG